MSMIHAKKQKLPSQVQCPNPQLGHTSPFNALAASNGASCTTKKLKNSAWVFSIIWNQAGKDKLQFSHDKVVLL